MSGSTSENGSISIAALELLPAEPGGSDLAFIRERLAASTAKVVILDDDPTGTQTIHDLPVLTHWSVESLVAELAGEYPGFFILTNSRSLPEEEAIALAEEIGRALAEASRLAGVRAVVISRSDSTLRGHFPAEVDAVARSMGKGRLPYVLIPFFLEGGRLTVNDIHYVQEGDRLIPAAMTPFARDAAFGFTSSDLKAWVEEKTGGAIAGEAVVSLALDEIRGGDVEALVEKLLRVGPGGAVIVNCVSYRDLEVVVMALLAAEAKGAEFLYRTAASFVRSRLGIEAGVGLLDPERLVSASPHGGLMVIGSYVPKTGRQIEALLALTSVAPVEVAVARLLDDDSRDAEIAAVTTRVDALLGGGLDVALFTSRHLITGRDSVDSLAIGKTVSDSLISIVGGLVVQPRYLVAKGGITSSDVATRGLGVKRAMVIGQAQPGVPAWRLGGETRYPGMTYIVFPGNVGDDEALARLARDLAKGNPEEGGVGGAGSC